MPAKKKAAAKKPAKSFEETLWGTANKLRGSVESSEYKHVVLSLIFLKIDSALIDAINNIEDKEEDIPGRYVGAAALEDDGVPFETKMTELSQTLYAQMEESAKLDEVILKNLEGLKYGK